MSLHEYFESQTLKKNNLNSFSAFNLIQTKSWSYRTRFSLIKLWNYVTFYTTYLSNFRINNNAILKQISLFTTFLFSISWKITTKNYRKIQTFSLRLSEFLSIVFARRKSSSPICLSSQIIYKTCTKKKRRCYSQTVEKDCNVMHTRMMRTVLGSKVNWQNENNFMLHFPIFGSDVEGNVEMGVQYVRQKVENVFALQIDSYFKSSSHARGIPQLCTVVVHIESMWRME